jgi:proline racemase
MKNWIPPEHWLKITTIDAHTEGEPFRVITGGYPELPGESTLARRRYAIENLDHLRTALMWEPRGHADMYGCIVTPPQEQSAHSRNVCIFAEGEVDRSPTGTGVSARLAIHHARGEIRLNEAITIESIIGSRFSGRVVQTTTCGPHPAIIPEVEGTAYITGRHEFLIDPNDPLRNGFLLG